MEKEVKYFLLSTTAAHGGQEAMFANVYDDFEKLRKDYLKLKDRLQLETYVLTPVSAGEDIVVAKVGSKLIACIGPKRPLNNDAIFVKCRMEMITIKNDAHAM